MIGKLTETEEKAVREFSRELRLFSGKNIKQILLFGSKARGDFNKESDIDLFILAGEVDSILKRQTAKIVNKLLLKYEVLISPRLIPEIRYAYQKRLETGFIKNVERDGIKIE
jgi:predicted nucleotidyltransferase